MVKKRVLLVPGFQNKKFDGREKWRNLADRLEKEGFEVMIASYSIGEPMKKSLFYYAGELKEELSVIKRPDVVIAHSMGCLVTRYAVEHLSAEYPERIKLILLEGPHQGLPNNGISFARITAKIFELIKRLPDWNVPSWDSWKDMQRGSEFFRQLNEERNAAKKNRPRQDVSYYEIGGLFAHLFPETFGLPKKICCSGRKIFPRDTHSGLKKDPKVIDYIVKIIKDP